MTECQHHEKVEDKCNQIDSLFKLVNEKVGLKSLISIMAIVVASIGLFIGILHSGYQDTINEIRKNNAITASLAANLGTETNKELSAIKVEITKLAKDVEHIMKGEK